MTSRILAGIETEYGLLVEGRGAEEQVEDSAELVASYPGVCFPAWDYRFETPRADLRGFTLERLSQDPADAKFDEERARPTDRELRSDRVLANGARFYNDHGHPEYATPECLSLRELALHDRAGENVVLQAACSYGTKTGRAVRLYKNNTDFHGASYGTHESYLVPRELGFDRLFRAITPVLIARQVLCGAGKVGAESGGKCRYQISQRADFFTEAASADTLFRRPVFNTRDESHADPRQWVRLHVISGDANMMPACTKRKVGLVKIALELESAGACPTWEIDAPHRAMQDVSRDASREYRIALKGRNWTTAYQMLDSYLCAYDALRNPSDPELVALVEECRMLLQAVREQSSEAARQIDWVAKLSMLEGYIESEGVAWNESELRAFDLEYHNLDPEEGLYRALEQSGSIAAPPEDAEVAARETACFEGTRALARSVAVHKFKDRLLGVSWGSLTFRGGEGPIEVALPPDRDYPAELDSASSVESFIDMIRGEP